MERSVTACSDKDDYSVAFSEVVATIREAAQGREPKLVVFCCSFLDFAAVSRRFSQSFPIAVVIGTTTYIGYTNKGFGASAICALAVFEGIECSAGTLIEITHYPMRYSSSIEDALERLSSPENTICLEYTTSTGMAEELVQDTFCSVLKERNIPVFGGSAGALDGAVSTMVSLNGIVYSEACVFAFIKNLNGRIGIFKETLFKPSDHFFTATDVDCDARSVYEYDNRPAAEVISDALRVPIEELNEVIMTHPVGRIDGDEIYITGCNRVFPDGRISYFSRVYNRTKLILLNPDDVDKVWNDTAKKVKEEFPESSFCIIVNCLSRMKYFISEGRLEDFNKKLTSEYGNYVGMSGFGEQMNYEHLNQTMIIAVFE